MHLMRYLLTICLFCAFWTITAQQEGVAQRTLIIRAQAGRGPIARGVKTRSSGRETDNQNDNSEEVKWRARRLDVDGGAPQSFRHPSNANTIINQELSE